MSEDTKKNKENKDPKVRWGAVITEQDKSRKDAYKLSMGRVMGWIMFGILTWMWIIMLPVPQSLVAVFLTIMAYNMGKKTDLFKDAIQQKTGAKEDKE